MCSTGVGKVQRQGEPSNLFFQNSKILELKCISIKPASTVHCGTPTSQTVPLHMTSPQAVLPPHHHPHLLPLLHDFPVVTPHPHHTSRLQGTQMGPALPLLPHFSHKRQRCFVVAPAFRELGIWHGWGPYPLGITHEENGGGLCCCGVNTVQGWSCRHVAVWRNGVGVLGLGRILGMEALFREVVGWLHSVAWGRHCDAVHSDALRCVPDCRYSAVEGKHCAHDSPLTLWIGSGDLLVLWRRVSVDVAESVVGWCCSPPLLPPSPEN